MKPKQEATEVEEDTVAAEGMVDAILEVEDTVAEEGMAADVMIVVAEEEDMVDAILEDTEVEGDIQEEEEDTATMVEEVVSIIEN